MYKFTFKLFFSKYLELFQFFIHILDVNLVKIQPFPKLLISSWLCFNIKSPLPIWFKIFSSEVSSENCVVVYKAIFIVFEQCLILSFNLISHKHVVLVLSTNWQMEIVFLTDSEGFVHSICIPITCPPVKRESIFNYLMESSTDLFDRSIFIKAMGIYDINII